MPDAAHDRLTRALHWLGVVLVALAWLLGEEPRDSPRLFGLHMGFGLLVLALTLPRLAWRGLHPPPPVPGPPLAQRLAAWAHAALYGLLLAVPLLGAAAVSLRGGTLHLFWLVSLPTPAPGPRWLAEACEGLHVFAANLLLALIVLHVAAALWHQWVLRDGLLGRMRPPWSG
jgi:cytochrome b561